jgi:hypothetical protein
MTRVTTDSAGTAGRHGHKRVLVDGEHVGNVAPRSDGYEAQALDRRPLAIHPTIDHAAAHVGRILPTLTVRPVVSRRQVQVPE